MRISSKIRIQSKNENFVKKLEFCQKIRDKKIRICSKNLNLIKRWNSKKYVIKEQKRVWTWIFNSQLPATADISFFGGFVRMEFLNFSLFFLRLVFGESFWRDFYKFNFCQLWNFTFLVFFRFWRNRFFDKFGQFRKILI